MLLVFGSHCGVTRKSLFVLRVLFTFWGFAKYAANTRGSEWNFCPMFYNMYYAKNDCDMGRGVWAFHGNLPLEERAEDGQALLLSE